MASMTSLGALEAASTALFVCDIQEKFRPAMEKFQEIVDNTQKLVSGCKVLDVPLVVTEQYPKGLGPTVTDLTIDHAVAVVPKTKFSMVVPEVTQIINNNFAPTLKSVVLCGVEAHVCVEQTAIDLICLGYTVHIVADCVTSRSQEDRILAFKRLEKIGCFITTVESVLFKLLGDKNHPKFKEVASLVKNKSSPTDLISRI